MYLIIYCGLYRRKRLLFTLILWQHCDMWMAGSDAEVMQKNADLDVLRQRNQFISDAE